MRASSFAAVAELSPVEQQDLFENGDDPERLWSAWAIALRLGSDAVPLLRSMEGHAAPEGLRRQLLVVLAGMGERRLLRAIANSEPSPSVQATASMLYLRTALDPTSPEIIAFALSQLRTAPAEVRRAVLDEQEAGHASIPAKELYPSLRDPDAATRIACAGCILKDPSSDKYLDGVHAVVEAFADEAHDDVRRELLAKIPRSAVADVLEAASRRDESGLMAALNDVIRQFGDLIWSDVSGIAPRATLPVIRTILASGIQPMPPTGGAWLCDAIRLASKDDSDLGREMGWRALFAIQPLLTEDTVTALASADRGLLRAAFEKGLAEHAAHVDDYGPDSDDGDYAAELERLVRLLSSVRPTA